MSTSSPSDVDNFFDEKTGSLELDYVQVNSSGGDSTDDYESADTGTSRSGGVTTETQMRPRYLFKGTYGQLEEALLGTGLVTLPCSGDGFDKGAESYITYNLRLGVKKSGIC